MTEFNVITACLGGGLIGLAAVLLMALNGRIAGISGIASGMMVAPVDDRMWRALFVAGLILAALVTRAASGHWPAFEMRAGTPVLIAAGLLVGFGTRLGSGCTSGHGVCGLSRASGRSLVSTGIFMIAGIGTVAVMNAIGATG